MRFPIQTTLSESSTNHKGQRFADFLQTLIE
jgi:hypothetical protein